MIESLLTALKIDKFNYDSVKVAFDIGSRDGLQALELAAAFTNANVFAIECNPDTLPQLRANIAASPRVHAIETAVSDCAGKVTFHKIDRDATCTPHADGNPGASSLLVARSDYPFEAYVQIPISVHCDTLDSICQKQNIDAIDIIWMDLQGAELKAFSGFTQRIERTRYIHVELTHREIYAGQPLFDEVDSYLQNLGFERISAIDRSSYFEDVIYRNRRFFSVIEPHVVLSQPWGGLGDNLALSTLPELYARNGVRTYLNTDNATRNDEIRNLVWSDNPFVLGTVNSAANGGSVTYEAGLPAVSLAEPYISRIEKAHKLQARNSYPEIFRIPNYLGHLTGKILIDLGSISVTGGPEKLTRYVQHVLTAYHYRMEDVLQVRFTNYSTPHAVYFSNIPVIDVGSLKDYHDVLYSVAVLITVHSGAQSLAVATRSQAGSKLRTIHCFANPYQFNTRMYIFDGVEYFVE